MGLVGRIRFHGKFVIFNESATPDTTDDVTMKVFDAEKAEERKICSAKTSKRETFKYTKLG